MIINRFIGPQEEAKKYQIENINHKKNSFYSVIQTNKKFQGFEKLDVSRKYSSSSVPAVHVQANNIGHYRCLDYNATKPVHNRDHSSNHRQLFGINNIAIDKILGPFPTSLILKMFGYIFIYGFIYLTNCISLSGKKICHFEIDKGYHFFHIVFF